MCLEVISAKESMKSSVKPVEGKSKLHREGRKLTSKGSKNQGRTFGLVAGESFQRPILNLWLIFFWAFLMFFFCFSQKTW